MVRLPHTPAQLEAGRRLGAYLRNARGSADPVAVARAAGISPETLRKIESGRLTAPAFGTVVGVARALGLPLEELAAVWESAGLRTTV